MEKVDDIQGSGNALDFGARIYDSRLGRWMSMDPLQAKYSFITPYNGFSNNPITNIDPDGNADIYYNGKYRGTDGKDDGIILIPHNRKVLREVKRISKSGMNYPEQCLGNGEKNDKFGAIHIDVLSQADKVLDKAIATSSTENEHMAIMKENPANQKFDLIKEDSPEYKPKKDKSGKVVGSLGETTIAEGEEGDVLIHSHPVGIYGDGKYHDAESASDFGDGIGDVYTFPKFKVNIIVGKTGDLHGARNTSEDTRPYEINVFNSKSEKQFSINRQEAKKIIKDYGTRHTGKK